MKVISALLDKKVDLNYSGNHFQTPLTLAVQNANITVLNLLINHGANINAQTRYGENALMTAVEMGNCSIDYCINFSIKGATVIINFDTMLGRAEIDRPYFATPGHQPRLATKGRPGLL